MVEVLQQAGGRFDIDGKRVTRFDPAGKDTPPDRQWHPIVTNPPPRHAQG